MRQQFKAGFAILLAWSILGTPAQAEDDLSGTRVMGGVPIGRGEFPSMVALHIAGPNAGTLQGHSCGATVIAARWALTAAHCVTRAQDGILSTMAPNVRVVAEPRQGGTGLEAGKVRLISLDKIIIHPGYAMRRLEGSGSVVALPNDIALLQLHEAALRPPQLLAGVDDRAALEQPGRGATVVGFGKINDRQQFGSQQLLYGDVPVADIELCRAAYRQRVPDIENLVGPTQFCAGRRGASVDACPGDSGGPLFVRGEAGDVIQIGVVSIGPPCLGRAAGSGSYTSVSAAAGWIAKYVPDASFTHGEHLLSPVPAPASQPAPPPAPFPTADGLERLSGPFSTAAEVSPAKTAQASVDIREGTRLKVGTCASFRVVSGISGLLVMLVRDPAGQWAQVFPNATTAGLLPGQPAQPVRVGQATPLVRAGQILVVAGAADSICARVRPPTGEGLLIAVVIPASDATIQMVAGQAGHGQIAEPDRYLAALGTVVQASRSMEPEQLPVHTAMAQRRFTVLP